MHQEPKKVGSDLLQRIADIAERDVKFYRKMAKTNSNHFGHIANNLETGLISGSFSMLYHNERNEQAENAFIHCYELLRDYLHLMNTDSDFREAELSKIQGYLPQVRDASLPAHVQVPQGEYRSGAENYIRHAQQKLAQKNSSDIEYFI